MINVFFFLMLLAQLIAAISQLLLKKSAMKEHPDFISEYLNAFVIGGYGLLVVSMAIVIFCYSGLDYMGVVVIEPISYVLVMILSRIVFGEKLAASKLLGMALIVGGIAVFYMFG